MNGQIQYGSARGLTDPATHAHVTGRRCEVAVPWRSRLRVVLFTLAAAAGIVLLIALPTRASGVAVTLLLAGIWVSLLLAILLPSPGTRTVDASSQRLAAFRHDLNAMGDHPTRRQLEDALTRARALDVPDAQIEDELTRIAASLEALTLQESLAAGQWPVVPSVGGVAAGDACHYIAPVRFGRRRSDQHGHLLLTTNWLTFRGTTDLSVTWSEVTGIRRSGTDLIVAAAAGTRTYRFSCRSAGEAARAGVLAEHLQRLSVARVSPEITAAAAGASA